MGLAEEGVDRRAANVLPLVCGHGAVAFGREKTRLIRNESATALPSRLVRLTSRVTGRRGAKRRGNTQAQLADGPVDARVRGYAAASASKLGLPRATPNQQGMYDAANQGDTQISGKVEQPAPMLMWCGERCESKPS